MSLITDTAALSAFCESLAEAPFITVDTEFQRERTYWPQLCLVQVAGPDEARAIDPLAPGIDLAPLFELMADSRVLKVFHAARQDLEIFLKLAGRLPAPIFDTQIAAMVCGFGDSVSYEALANSLARARIDKSMRFTDWTQRPLSKRQLDYALSDVTHLRVVYEKLRRKLDGNGRAQWLEEEVAVLSDPATYRVDPRQAWRRLKPRSSNPRFLAILRELADWREREAQEKDVPRNRVARDEALTEVAAHAPTTAAELARMRAVPRGTAEGRYGQQMLEAVARAVALPDEELPQPPQRVELPRGLAPVVDLLKVLLKMKCDQHHVAQRLVASAADVEAIAADDDADVPALHGWRRQVFGEDALRLKNGGLALAVSPSGRRLRLVALDEAAPPDEGG